MHGLGNADGDVVVMQHGPTLKELVRNDMRNAVYATPAVANSVLYVVTQRNLVAIASQPQSGN